jgi:pyruvate dehydrogenase E2 component (dihydrolipoamide acetyltransferase)
LCLTPPPLFNYDANRYRLAGLLVCRFGFWCAWLLLGPLRWLSRARWLGGRAVREQLNARLAGNSKSGGGGSVQLSLNDMLLKAAASACGSVPEVNSSWMGSFIRQYRSVDINVMCAGPEAADGRGSSPSGSVAPVLRDVGSKGLAALAAELAALSARARSGGLSPSELAPGTLSVSNLGAFGVASFAPIIAAPQAASLAIGAVSNRLVPAAAGGEPGGPAFETASMLSVTLACDHRVVDGAVGAAWLAQFRKLVEDPVTLLL